MVGRDCPECACLWKLYQRATVEHVRAERELKRATDNAELNRLRREVEELEKARQLTRVTLAQHQKESGHG